MVFRACLFPAVTTVLLLTGCSTAPAQENRTPRAAKDLADALAGRSAGPSERCIPTYRNTKVQVIDDWTILYDQGSTIYVQNPPGGCPGLRSGDTLVTRQIGTAQLCQGEIAHTVDLTSGVQGGGCVLGPFIPYTRAGN